MPNCFLVSLVCMFVFCMGSEAWPLTTREQYGLKCWRIGCWRRFGPKKHEVTVKWGRRHNDELNDPALLTRYHWGVRIKKNVSCGAGGRYGRLERCIQRRPEGKRPLGRHRCRRECNITVDAALLTRYHSGDRNKKNVSSGAGGMYGRLERCIQRRPEGKRPLGWPRCRRECNITVDVQEVWWGGMDWIDLAQDRDRWWALVNGVMKLRFPGNMFNFWELRTW